MSVAVAEAVPLAVPARSGSQRALGWLPAAVTVLVAAAVLLVHGTALLDIIRYALYVVLALMLPGTLVYRALRGTPHSLVDDLAMGTALGFVLEVVAYAAYAAAGWQRYLWTWPAFVIALFLAVPALRRHWRRPAGYRPAPLGWSWVVAGIAVSLIVYLGVTYLRLSPVPRTGAHWYYLDWMYLLGLVGDAMNHFPPGSPQVASEPLNYHWFTYAHMASASLITGIDAPIVYFRLALPVICTVAVLLMAVVGWRVSGRPWVGALAAALMFVVAEFTATDYILFGMVGRWMIANSPSMSYAWLATFPLVMIGVDRVRRAGLPDAPLGRGAWVLLALFAAAASGAKATILPILLCGFALAGAAELGRRRFPRNIAIASAVVLAILVAATVVLYKGESGGLRLSPLRLLRFYVPDVPRTTTRELGVLGFVGVAYAVYLLARLAGIPVLAWLSWRRRGPVWEATEWFLLGATVAGIAGTLLLGHVTSAQVYLLRSAWPFAVILSAMGLAALVERYRTPRRVVAGALVVAITLAAVLIGLQLLGGFSTPGKGPRAVLPIYWAALVTFAVCGAFALVWRRRSAVLILALVLVMGIPVFVREVFVSAKADQETSFYSERVTPDGIAAADWVRANVPSGALLATNGHCPAGHPSNDRCFNLSSWLSAYAQRRVLVGGWGYSPRSTAQAVAAWRWIGAVPFFDEPKLAANEAAFYQPTAAGLADLRDRYGVGWLVVDRTVAGESPELRRFATLRFERGAYAVYELR